MDNEKDKIKEYEAILRKSLKEIELLKTKLTDFSEPIAIIGMSCRFPGNCNTPDEYWNLISTNLDAISDIPADRWNIDDYYDPDPEIPGKMYMRKGGFITQNIDQFDARIFNISPTEAIDLDPQQRILLELAWEAFQNAGLDSSLLVGSRTGVFLGLAAPDYVKLVGDKKIHDLTQYTAYSITGTISCMASGRISHYFGLQGPAISLDTACSSSLVSTQLACTSIQRGECDMALAGGINLNLSPLPFVALSRTRALAADGHCKTFDARGDGYGRSEGGGMVLLKRLSLALKDRDPILAVIKGGAINQDGPSSGLTVPNGQAQELLLKQALKSANLSSEDIGYLEAHGTGTVLGDPIEMHSVATVLGKNRKPDNFLYLGAVKSNIGHTESAAGIAGVIKAALCLQHKKIPPMKVEQVNPRIDLNRIPAKIPGDLIDWESHGRSRYAGVSAFALSGTNAHLILGEAPPQKISTLSDSAMQVFTVSAKTEEAFKALIHKYSEFLQVTEHDWFDIAYSANLGRKHFPLPHRVAFIADSKASLKHQLDNYLAGNAPAELRSDDKLTEIARAYSKGSDINWKDFYGSVSHNKVILPNYPFQRKPYWIALDSYPTITRSNILTNPLNGIRLPTATHENIFVFQISLENLPEVLDVARSLHIGFSQEMLINALMQLEPLKAYTVQDMSFVLPLLIEPNENRSVALTLIKDVEGSYRFKFQSYQISSGKWSLHIQGTVRTYPSTQSIIQRIGQTGTPTYDSDSFYKMLDARTMVLGASVHLVDKIWVQGDQLLAKFFLKAQGANDRPYIIPLDPAVFDTCAQVFHALLPESSPPDFKMMVLKLGELSVNFPSSGFSELWCHFKMVGKDPTIKDVYIGEFSLQNERGELIAQCHDFRMKGATDAALKSLSEAMTGLARSTEGDFPKRAAILRASSDEQMQLTQEVILEELSRVLTLSKEEVNPNESINSLGMDSIMGITLKRDIQKQLGTDIPLEEIVQGPNLIELTKLVLNLIFGTSEKQMHMNSQWFMGTRKPQATFRLFCLPYGGGGASIYRDWQNLFSDKIDVCPIQLPGRESRIKESPYTDIASLVEDLTTALKPMLDRPFGFFGHSFGALLAYELAKSLPKKFQISPKHIFVSAFTSPHLPNTRVALLKSDPRMLDLLNSDILGNTIRDEASLLLWAKYFPELEKMPIDMQPLYIKIGLADLKTVEGSPIQTEKIDCDLTSFWGADDSSVPERDVLAWQELCNKKIKVYQMKGDHLFMNDPTVRKELIRIIEEELKLCP